MTDTLMRSHHNIADLQPGQRLEDEVYLVLQKDLRTTSNGSLYIHAVLADRTGQMVARMWNATREVFNSIPTSGPLMVTGRVESYKGKPQFIIDGVSAVEDESLDPSLLLPATERDVDQMWQRVKEILRQVRNPHLLRLLAAFVNDEDFVRGFKRAPAARTNHHAYLGGLLEHTLSLLELALVVLPRYPQVSSDLVLSGLFLHDAGKIAELDHTSSFEYTTEGQLVGHIVLTATWVARKVQRLEDETGQAFPRDLLAALQHIIVSHHGKYEFGSPRLPATAEAVMVHYLDNLDAKLTMVFSAIAGDEDDESDWTKWVPALETRVFKPDTTRED